MICQVLPLYLIQRKGTEGTNSLSTHISETPVQARDHQQQLTPADYYFQELCIYY